jgi:hypothetical protein
MSAWLTLALGNLTKGLKGKNQFFNLVCAEQTKVARAPGVTRLDAILQYPCRVFLPVSDLPNRAR